MNKSFLIRAFRQLRCRRALARLSTVLTACALLATIPNALLSCSKKSELTSPASSPASTATSSSASGSQESSRLSNKIDLDLTKMSATMIYSTMFDMLIMPEDYVEKNIKVKGWFQTYTDPYTAELYYAVVVPDATACCQQGLEFVWLGEHHFPTDFPDLGADITVTGRYKITETDGITYNYLEASSVEF